jgi:hypothetical protein
VRVRVVVSDWRGSCGTTHIGKSHRSTPPPARRSRHTYVIVRGSTAGILFRRPRGRGVGGRHPQPLTYHLRPITKQLPLLLSNVAVAFKLSNVALAFKHPHSTNR